MNSAVSYHRYYSLTSSKTLNRCDSQLQNGILLGKSILNNGCMDIFTQLQKQESVINMTIQSKYCNWHSCIQLNYICSKLHTSLNDCIFHRFEVFHNGPTLSKPANTRRISQRNLMIRKPIQTRRPMKATQDWLKQSSNLFLCDLFSTTERSFWPKINRYRKLKDVGGSSC